MKNNIERGNVKTVVLIYYYVINYPKLPSLFPHSFCEGESECGSAWFQANFWLRLANIKYEGSASKLT